MKINFNNRSIIFTGLIALIFLIFPSKTIDTLQVVINFLLHTLDRPILWLVSCILMVCVGIAISPLGKIKLGDEPPEFSTFSWVAMLFAAGMGSGLIFWGVAEPVYHLNAPINTTHDPMLALSITNFHWGLHAWGIYAFSGLTFAWFAYKKGREMDVVSSLTKKNNEAFKILNFLGVISIIFGVAGTLANSIALIQSGIEHYFSSSITTGLAFRIVLLSLLTMIFTVSSITGLKKGVKLLSDFNVVLALLLLGIIFLMNNQLQTIQLFLSSVLSYLQELPSLSFFIDEPNRPWSQSWSIIYFLWWIAWAPFTGLFIARISKGRSIREFILSILIYPTLVSVLWFAVFGGNAMHSHQIEAIQSAVNENYTFGLFTYLELFDIAPLLGGICILLLITFVITSADSAIYVTSMLTNNTSRINKMTWALLLYSITIGLLYQNNVDLNKVIAIFGAFPFTLILILQGISLMKSIIRNK
ncbi:BCCT family transporter [Flammeovirga yaeyamensis]|uniref:BCCT family transporter n=1 Tax=Flammeovirga yaeyamensis TaxID=367791 RepID=A0AAX1N7Q0_9BACT|nr:BCCT family transporter [Flammeovirga yaeyamensis]MBB3700622.1 glycine betaine transporter [Flammeovirga yaeyamensis]NMF37738.1 BCCT transporter [Flammeovirga yaeyamensis]QWG02047.1 BCCT family transporter [Flammeovirga yaeyamensis]